MRSADEIVHLYSARRTAYAPVHAGMGEIKNVYDNNAMIDLPDMDTAAAASVPNLLRQGVDQMAGRVSSVVPMVSFASDKPGQRTADRRADTCGRVVHGWWQRDKVPLKNKVRARHLLAYGMSPVVIRWLPSEHRPTWEVRPPMEAYPAQALMPGSIKPIDIVFAYQRSVRWLAENGYANNVTAVLNNTNWRETPDMKMTLVEYVDADCQHLILTGWADNPSGPMGGIGWTGQGDVRRVSTLQYAQHPVPVMTAFAPQRVGLTELAGQFDGMLGMYYQQARLEALEIIAVEKGIFPDVYLVSRQGEVGKFLDGPHDGRTGKVNVVAGGTVQEIATNPGYQTNPTIDRLERSQRLTAGIPSEFGGESSTNVRTGRRGDAVLSAAIDFPVAEAQELFAATLEDENVAAIELAKAYDGDTTRTIYVGTGNAARSVSYNATEVFTHGEHTVSFPVVGTDVNSLVIGLGQRVGMGLMSKETAAQLDPYIASPELEHDRIIGEGLEQALVASLQQKANDGSMPPLVLAQISKLVVSDKMEVMEAFDYVMKEAEKAQQAAADAAQQTPGPTDMAMAGAAPPALSGSPIPGLGQGQDDLATLMSQLRRPQMTVQPQRNVPTGGV